MLRVALIRMVYMGVMFLAGLVLSNLALPERFGAISLLILNASLLSLVTGLGTESMILFKVSNKHWSTSQGFRFAWRSILVQIFIFLLLELGSFFAFHTTLLSAESFNYFPIEALYFLGLVVVEKYLSLFYSVHQSKTPNRLLALVSFGYLSSLLLFYYFVDIDFVYILYLFALQSLIQGIVLAAAFGFSHLDNSNFESREFLSAIKLSSVVMITNVVQLFAYRIDFWLLNYFYGNTEVGLYAQANKFANLSWVIPNILAQLLMPRFAEMEKQRIKDVFCISFYSNIVVLLVTVACTLMFYLYYLKPEYCAGLPTFYYMLPGYFFWGSVIYFAAFYSSAGKFSYNLVGSIICLILISIADIILIPTYGIDGAALANSLVYSAVFVYYIIVLKRKSSFRIVDLLRPHKNALSNIIKFVGSE